MNSVMGSWLSSYCRGQPLNPNPQGLFAALEDFFVEESMIDPLRGSRCSAYFASHYPDMRAYLAGGAEYLPRAEVIAQLNKFVEEAERHCRARGIAIP